MLRPKDGAAPHGDGQHSLISRVSGPSDIGPVRQLLRCIFEQRPLFACADGLQVPKAWLLLCAQLCLELGVCYLEFDGEGLGETLVLLMPHELEWAKSYQVT